MKQKNKPASHALIQANSLTVYARENCHLCHDMIIALQNLQKQVLFNLQVIDIDTKPELVALYGENIPVLVSTHTNQEICHHFLDLAALDDYIGKFR